MKRFIITAAACFSLALSGLVLSADIAVAVRGAQQLLAAGEYERAFDEYLSLATRQDNPLAQLALALFYHNGWGRPADPVQACKWYGKAAQAGELPAAADAWGRCLAAGTLDDPDYPQAIIWYQKAADMGHHYSLCRMGDLYIAGKGVPRDAARGVALCGESAQQGSVPAMLQVARLYLEEDDIRDPKLALQWYSTAASFHSTEAQYQLGLMLRDGIGAARDPLAARRWFEEAASRGYVPAYYETAVLYFNAPTNPENGLWYEEDLAKAYLWLSASQQCSADETQRRRVAEMLKDVLSVMPATWQAELDAKLAAHLEEYPAAGGEKT